jgi:hypothetical protein
MATNCAACRKAFEPSTYSNQHRAASGGDAKRLPATYCSNRCRQAAYRRRTEGCPDTHAVHGGTGVSVRYSDVSAPTLPGAVTRAPDASLGRRYPGGVSVVADGTYPGMYRVRMPDGSLTDMVNRARAWEAARMLSEQS